MSEIKDEIKFFIQNQRNPYHFDWWKQLVLILGHDLAILREATHDSDSARVRSRLGDEGEIDASFVRGVA